MAGIPHPEVGLNWNGELCLASKSRPPLAAPCDMVEASTTSVRRDLDTLERKVTRQLAHVQELNERLVDVVLQPLEARVAALENQHLNLQILEISSAVKVLQDELQQERLDCDAAEARTLRWKHVLARHLSDSVGGRRGGFHAEGILDENDCSPDRLGKGFLHTGDLFMDVLDALRRESVQFLDESSANLKSEVHTIVELQNNHLVVLRESLSKLSRAEDVEDLSRKILQLERLQNQIFESNVARDNQSSILKAEFSDHAVIIEKRIADLEDQNRSHEKGVEDLSHNVERLQKQVSESSEERDTHISVWKAEAGKHAINIEQKIANLEKQNKACETSVEDLSRTVLQVERLQNQTSEHNVERDIQASLLKAEFSEHAATIEKKIADLEDQNRSRDKGVVDLSSNVLRVEQLHNQILESNVERDTQNRLWKAEIGEHAATIEKRIADLESQNRSRDKGVEDLSHNVLRVERLHNQITESNAERESQSSLWKAELSDNAVIIEKRIADLEDQNRARDKGVEDISHNVLRVERLQNQMAESNVERDTQSSLWKAEVGEHVAIIENKLADLEGKHRTHDKGIDDLCGTVLRVERLHNQLSESNLERDTQSSLLKAEVSEHAATIEKTIADLEDQNRARDKGIENLSRNVLRVEQLQNQLSERNVEGNVQTNLLKAEVGEYLATINRRIADLEDHIRARDQDLRKLREEDQRELHEDICPRLAKFESAQHRTETFLESKTTELHKGLSEEFAHRLDSTKEKVQRLQEEFRREVLSLRHEVSMLDRRFGSFDAALSEAAHVADGALRAAEENPDSIASSALTSPREGAAAMSAGRDTSRGQYLTVPGAWRNAAAK